MKIAFLDHSYHKKTNSTAFLAEMLKRAGHEVEYIWDDTWRGGSDIVFDDIVGKYDVFVIFQAIPVTSVPFSETGANITFVPMLDAFDSEYSLHLHLPRLKFFSGCKILCFSKHLASAYLSNGIAAKFYQYFPNAEEFRATNQTTGLKGFFWARRPDQIDWRMIKQILEKTNIDSMHIHINPDPGVNKVLIPHEDMHKFNITVTNWFEDKKEYIEKVANSNIYFAPRYSEGIGMSFLEAMAMGKCVIAPNVGTMNEYIISGINGVLYDIDSDNNVKIIPEALSLDYDSIQTMGQNARKSIELGYQYWLSKEKELVEFITEDLEVVYNAQFQLSIEPPPAIDSSLSCELLPPKATIYGRLRSKLKQYSIVRNIYFALKGAKK